MLAPHLLLGLGLAFAAAPARFAGAPLPAAELIFQIEARRLPAESLAPLLAEADPGVRALAARAAGRLHAPAALLAGVAADPDVAVRRAAAEALGFVSDARPVVRARLVHETDAAARVALWRALGRVGTTADVSELVSALQGPERQVAAEALGRLGTRRVDGAGSEATVVALLDAVEAPWFRFGRQELTLGPEARRTAAWALSRTPIGRLSAPVSARLKARALADPDLRVRAWLVKAAAALGPDAAFLAAASRDDAAPVRLAAIRGMARGGCDADALAARFTDDDHGVRQEALGAAAGCAGVPVEPLLAALTSGTAAERAAALRSLHQLRKLPAALAEFQGEAWPLAVRIAAVEEMKERPRLLRLARTHADPRLRSAAAGVILGAESPPRPSEIVELLGATDPVLVQAAAQAAVESPDPSFEAPLVGLLTRRDADRATAAAAVRALDAIYATGRLPVPKADTRAALRKWVVLPELAAVRARVVKLIGGEEPPQGHPDRALPSLAEVAAVRGARVITTEGELRIELLPEVAPLTVWNFATLAEAGYFDGLVFHRVVPDFVIQTGDPRGDGWGGPGFELPDELSGEPYAEGTVGMALSGPDTGGSQWFVTTAPHPHLDFGYTVFGRLVRGHRAAQAVDIEDRIVDVIIERAR